MQAAKVEDTAPMNRWSYKMVCVFSWGKFHPYGKELGMKLSGKFKF